MPDTERARERQRRDSERLARVRHGTQLALAARGGDADALDDWIRTTQRDVWRFIANLTGSDLADDLCQETYARAIGGLVRFEGRSSSLTWLLSIARHVVVDDIRRRSSRRERLMAEDEPVEPAVVAADPVVELGLLVRALDPDRRQALVLTQVIGLSYAEAAEVLDCPVGTIRSRVFRARETLAETLHGPSQDS